MGVKQASPASARAPRALTAGGAVWPVCSGSFPAGLAFGPPCRQAGIPAGPGLSSAGGDQGLVADGGPHPQPSLVEPALKGSLADTGDLGGLLG
jgi:hypothetical protein